VCLLCLASEQSLYLASPGPHMKDQGSDPDLTHRVRLHGEDCFPQNCIYVSSKSDSLLNNDNEQPKEDATPKDVVGPSPPRVCILLQGCHLWGWGGGGGEFRTSRNLQPNARPKSKIPHMAVQLTIEVESDH